MFTEQFIVAPAISPIANLNATATSVYINVKGGCFVNWLYVQKSAGTNTGTQTITVLAATSSAGAGATAVPFRYRKKVTATTSDTWGNTTAVSASGFATTANEDTIYEVEIDPATITAVLGDGYNYVALKSTQLVADTVLGCVIAIVQDTRFSAATIPTVLV